MINPLDYYSQEEWSSFYKNSKKFKTPFLLVNLDIIKNNYLNLQKYFPFIKIFYAIKANPSDQIINLVNSLNSNFDVASSNELKQLLKLGINTNKISYGNTIKKIQDIKFFYKNCVKLFVVDNENDLINISKYAPNSKIFCRFLFDGGNADWSLSKKFGCSIQMAKNLLYKASIIGLVPYGVSFHVGSQQRDCYAWKQAILTCKEIFDDLAKRRIQLKLINMGGGLPCNYVESTNSLEYYSNQINNYIKTIFPNYKDIEFIMQPGRSLVGNSGVLITEIIQIAQKHYQNQQKWIYLDAGKFNGLIQTLNESIKYPIWNEKNTNENNNFIIAGPTCDSCDIIYEKTKYNLSNDLKQKDRLIFLSCGAYTASYASVGFNGFKPIKTYFINS